MNGIEWLSNNTAEPITWQAWRGLTLIFSTIVPPNTTVVIGPNFYKPEQYDWVWRPVGATSIRMLPR